MGNRDSRMSNAAIDEANDRLHRAGIALETFRRDFGVNANPEDFPQLWEQYLIAADEISENEEE